VNRCEKNFVHSKVGCEAEQSANSARGAHWLSTTEML